MTDWTADELRRIGASGELRIASVRVDGSLSRPVIIWGVRVGDQFYVRSVNGVDAGWFRATRARREGRVSVRGLEKDVAFEDLDPKDAVNASIDQAYRQKYGAGSSAVRAITSRAARQATLKIVPR